MGSSHPRSLNWRRDLAFHNFSLQPSVLYRVTARTLATKHPVKLVLALHLLQIGIDNTDQRSVFKVCANCLPTIHNRLIRQ
jgi:hypothetical protein